MNRGAYLMYRLPFLIILLISCIGLAASAVPATDSGKVTLTLYTLDDSAKGSVLPGVTVSCYDSAGNRFSGVTGTDGSVAIEGEPGNWKISLAKDGYETASLDYSATKTHVAAAYLKKSSVTLEQKKPYQQQEASLPGESYQQQQPRVTLTVFIHEGSLTGPQLSGVEVTGTDASGKSVSGITDSQGSVDLEGEPGAWKFAFSKEGYDTLNLDYAVEDTHEAAAFLQRSTTPEEQSAYAQASQERVQEQAVPQEQPILQEQLVSLTIYAHEGNLTGPELSGVQITIRDAGGSNIETATGDDGSATVRGMPGEWLFAFSREGYGQLNLAYNVTETHVAAVYLEKTATSLPAQETSQEQVTPEQVTEQVQPPEEQAAAQVLQEQPAALTVYVREGSLTGPELPGVRANGQDGVGNGFDVVTGSDGTAVIQGLPGTWQFDFFKEGYEHLSLAYNVEETHEAAVYLQRTGQSEGMTASVQGTTGAYTPGINDSIIITAGGSDSSLPYTFVA